MTPESTPREAMYIESGLLDVITTSESKRMNMKARLNREKSDLLGMIIRNPQCQWELVNRQTMEKHNIIPNDLIDSKYQSKQNIKKKINQSFKNIIENSCQNKSKMEYFLELKDEAILKIFLVCGNITFFKK